MTMTTLFYISLGLYAAALLVELAGVAVKRDKWKNLAWWVFVLALLTHLGYFVWRGLVAQRLPLSSQFEFSCGFALGVSLLLLVARTRLSADWIAAAGMAAVTLLMVYASRQKMEISELMPALRSFWFDFHIGAAVFSYAAFLVAGCVSLRYVLQHRKGEAPDSLKMKKLEYLSYRLVALGFLLLTAVIVIGAIWAEAAWSAYWTWDPKEVWALITWIIYAVYLHIRLRRQYSDLFLSWYVILAIPAFLFTFAGVNKLLPGLHSYA
ncbi:MAG: c-type cytochrome biogenesis protein CcsB [Oscillospiraceae bacterium]|nr:c-type cytochrome biogenesis protein CcsB [Oscillospiraceae bacterium]